MSSNDLPKFGKYQVIKRLDKGAMGEVFAAYQPLLERRVAIKVLHPHLASGEDFVERFKREAAVVARLRHSGIMQVYDFDVADGRYYMVMEFLDGPTLKAEMEERIREGRPFSFNEIGYIATAMASALDYAHARGMIHRDIKPANIMFNDEGQIVLTDFGIVHIVGDAGGSTQAGQIIGTPAYISPEQGAGKPVGAASDIYSLGVVLYQLASGSLPFEADSAISMVMKHVNEPVPPLSQVKAGISPAVEAAIMKALHKDPEKRYRRAGSLARALRQAIGMSAEQALAAVNITAVPDNPPTITRQVGTTTDDDVTMISQSVPGSTIVASGPGPYRGLFAFREVDANFFFGREAFTEELVSKVYRQPLTAVVGPSGSGKSSVVFAGLVATIRAEGGWDIDHFRPGSRPFEALAGAVVPLLWPDLEPERHPAASARLAQQLRRREVRLFEVVERLDRLNPEQRVLFVIDQFEELFTLCTDVDLRHRFLDEILDVVDIQKFLDDQRFALVLTLRADFLGQALAYRPLADALQGADVKLGPMSREDLSRAITNPARRLGVEFESGLVLRILNDVGDEPGNLPLLEFALSALWDQRSEQNLTHAAYERIGGVEGALARHANEVYEDLSLSDQKLARRVFVQLVQPGEGTEDTRRVATREELGADAWRLVQELADARLVVTGVNSAGTETVEVVHEALIRTWGVLRGWMESDRAFRAWQERLRQARDQWERSGRDDGALLRGVVLEQAREWTQNENAVLVQQEETFIQASVAAQEKREAEEEAQRRRELEQERALSETRRRQVRLVRGAAALLTVLLIMAVGAAIFAFVQRGNANANAEEAELQATAAFVAQETAIANEMVAATRAVEAESARTTAEAEREEAERQQRVAEEAQSEALAQREEAERQSRIALAQSLAALSGAVLEQNYDTELSTLLAVQAAQLNRESSGNLAWYIDQALRTVLSAPFYNVILRSHTDSIRAVDFSPDGRYLASAGFDRTVRIWNLGNLEAPPVVLEDTDASVRTVAFSADGGHIAAAGEDNLIRIWSLDALDQPALLLRGHSDIIWGLAFSPDNRLLASASDDGTVRVWEWNAASIETTVLDDYSDQVLAVAFSPDGSTLASSGVERTIFLHDVSNLEAQPATLEGHEELVWALSFSPDSELLASASNDETVRVWSWRDNASNPVILDSHDDDVRGVAFSPDGRFLISASKDQLVRVWLADDLSAPPALLPGHEGWLWSVDVSPDSTLLASTGLDATIRLWNLGDSPGEPEQLEGFDGWVWSTAFSSDGNWLATGGDDQLVRIWDARDFSSGPRELAGHEAGIRSVAFAPNRPVLASAGMDGTIRIWRLDEPDSDPVVLSEHEEWIRAVAFSPDGALLASASADLTVRVWNMELAEPEVVAVLPHDDLALGVAFSPDGSWIASASSDRNVRLWSVDDLNASPILLSGHEDSVFSVAFDPAGRLLASASADRTVRMWNLQDLEAPPRIFYGHDGAVLSVAFSPDGQVLISAGDDRSMRLWNASGSTAPPTIIEGHDGVVRTARFSPDGETIVSGSNDESVKIWAYYEPLIAIGCGSVHRDLTMEEWEAYIGASLPYEPACATR